MSNLGVAQHEITNGALNCYNFPMPIRSKLLRNGDFYGKNSRYRHTGFFFDY